MPTDEDYQYLEWLARNDGHVTRQDAELFDKERTKKLLDLGLIEYFFARGDGRQYFLRSYWLTLQGSDALLQRDQAQKQMQQAKDEATHQQQAAADQQLHDLRSAEKKKYLASGFRAVVRVLGAFLIEHVNHIPASLKRLIEVLLGK